MQIRGVELSVNVMGKGLPFIWCHGIASSQDHEDESGLFRWDSVAEIAQWVRYDARGHGASGASLDAEDYTWPNLGFDMLSIADALNVNKFVAGGASMGCATALFAALAAPRIAGLVLSIPPTAWETRSPQIRLYEDRADTVRNHGIEPLVELYRQQPQAPFFAKESPELKEINLRYLAAMNQKALTSLFQGAALSDLPSQEILEALTVPSLILAWAGDSGHPLSTAHSLNRLLFDSFLHIAGNIAEIHTWPRIVHGFIKDLTR